MQPHEPEDNRPGHHPDEEQDKPDLDDFAARFGTAPADASDDGDAAGEANDAPIVDDVTAPHEPLPLTVIRSALDLGEVALRTGVAVGGAVVRPIVGGALDLTGHVAGRLRR